MRCPRHCSPGETVPLRTDKQKIDLAMATAPLRAPPGYVVGVAEGIRDITRLRATAAGLSFGESRFRAIFDNTSQFI